MKWLSRLHPLVASLLLTALSIAFAPVAGAQEATKTFIMHSAPKPLASISFADGQGQKRSLSEFKGKVVVLNIWATWCVPCREEMPTLDRLQAALGGADFEVMPLSVDRGGLDIVSKFFAEIGVNRLGKIYRHLRPGPPKRQCCWTADDADRRPSRQRSRTRGWAGGMGRARGRQAAQDHHGEAGQRERRRRCKQRNKRRVEQHADLALARRSVAEGAGQMKQKGELQWACQNRPNPRTHR